MDIVYGLENLPGAGTRCVVTDGAFDGVHLGHQALVRRVVVLGRSLRGRSCVVTYEPLPSEFFGGGAAAGRLTLLDEKLEFFQGAGLDLCAILRFYKGLSEWACGEFVRRVLCEGLGAIAVVAGAGHTLGAGGQGTLATLRGLGAELGFVVESVPDAMHAGERVSSSSIRAALRAGDVAKAAAMLGRPYSVRGTVAAGKGVGQRLGYPTANLQVDDRKLLPADGVYAGTACVEAQRYPAVAHLGGSPTFGEAGRLVEVHVLDREIQLRGRVVCFEMRERIRNAIRFRSHAELKQQIEADVERARQLLLDQAQGCTGE